MLTGFAMPQKKQDSFGRSRVRQRAQTRRPSGSLYGSGRSVFADRALLLRPQLPIETRLANGTVAISGPTVCTSDAAAELAWQPPEHALVAIIANAPTIFVSRRDRRLDSAQSAGLLRAGLTPVAGAAERSSRIAPANDRADAIADGAGRFLGDMLRVTDSTDRCAVDVGSIQPLLLAAATTLLLWSREPEAGATDRVALGSSSVDRLVLPTEAA